MSLSNEKEVTITISGEVGSGKSVIAVLIDRLLSEAGANTEIVDEDAVTPLMSQLYYQEVYVNTVSYLKNHKLDFEKKPIKIIMHQESRDGTN